MVAEDFDNRQIAIDSLPSIDDLDLVGLDKRYLTVDIIGNIIFWAIVAIGISTLLYFNPMEAPNWVKMIIVAFLLVVIIMSFIVRVLGYKKKQYAVRERDIIYQEGLLWRKYTVLPFNRIQHAEVHQGPIERIFELSKLKIYTAGGSSSDLAIPGLEINTAQAMKQFVLNKSTSDEEE